MENMLTIILPAIISGGLGVLLTSLFNRRKMKAEVAKLTSETLGAQAEVRRSDAEIIMLSGDKLISWIEKFELAKEEALKLEIELMTLKRQLDHCLQSKGDCGEILTVIQGGLYESIDRLERGLHELQSKEAVAAELTKLRKFVDDNFVKSKTRG